MGLLYLIVLPSIKAGNLQDLFVRVMTKTKTFFTRNRVLQRKRLRSAYFHTLLRSRSVVSPSVCLSVCRLSHSCTLLKPFDGFRCYWAGASILPRPMKQFPASLASLHPSISFSLSFPIVALPRPPNLLVPSHSYPSSLSPSSHVLHPEKF